MKVFHKGQPVELKEGSTAKDLAEKLNLREPNQAIAVLINDTPCDLVHPLKEGDHVQILHFEDPAGKEVFWHTSAHVLAQAILRIWPEAKPTIGPPIENGFYYDFANLHVTEEDFPKIEKEMKKILSENLQPELYKFKDKQEALQAFRENPYKCELIQSFDENAPLTAYRQGEFFDLCRGPHLSSLNKIKALKVLKTSGAYWRGDSTREMLTRIYGITFPSRADLKDYLHKLEEAKRRDHRTIGAKLNLFSFHDESPAMPFIHPKGLIIWNKMLQHLRELHNLYGYEEIKTPQILSKELWELSGHWDFYREHMYTTEVEEKEFAIKPMNCPGCLLYYNAHSHSYRQLPLRVAEIGHVHRFEPSGAVNGLFRVRSFHQDDAHVFMKPSDIKSEILSVLKLAHELYTTFDLHNTFELSTRPEKSIGSDEDWEMTTNSLKQALDEWGQPYRINEGDGAFYGPKIDLHVQDALGRSWQCGTIQLDMSLPEKFQLLYRDKDGLEKRPIMIHRAIYGSIERFFGIIIEHFAGKFPLWLSPLQARVLTVADRHDKYAGDILQKIRHAGFIADIDDAGESISKKVRNAQLQQINYILTVGDKEVENETVSVRTRDNVVHGEMKLHYLLNLMTEECNSKSLTSHIKKEA
ncbi:MAG: threonine--tRNA ligase [Simkaniaceae bacterium]